jgi:molybdopterin molybdotransferase
VTPPVAGLAASVGHDQLLVAPAARVDVLVLGDELATHGLPGPGRTRDALGPQLPAWLRSLGAEVRAPRGLPDDCAALTAALRDCDGDVVVTTGGTSVGEHDHLHEAVERTGGRLLVDGVDVKPGHPMLLARLPGGRWLVGLPGNPLAACVALVTLVAPLLRTLHGEAEQPLEDVVLTGDEPGRPGDGHRLLPARRRADGTADVLPSCGSAMLRGLAQATGLAVVPPEGAAAGAVVGYLPLPWS